MSVHRTFGFIDLSGFTAYTEDRDAESAAGVLTRLRSVVRAVTQRHGVRVARWLGDGAMLSSVEPRAMLSSVLAVRDTVAAEGPLPVRGGIADGPAIMFEGDDYVGAAVNAAALLAERARPGQVLTTAAAAAQLPDHVMLRRCEPLRMPGSGRLIDVHELLTARDAGPARRRARRNPYPVPAYPAELRP